MRRTTLQPRNRDRTSKPKVGEWFAEHADSERTFEKVLRDMQDRYLGGYDGYIDRDGYPEYRFDGTLDDHGSAYLYAREYGVLVRFWVDSKKLTLRWRKSVEEIKNRWGNPHEKVDIKIDNRGDFSEVESFIKQNRITTFAGHRETSKNARERTAIEQVLGQAFDHQPARLDGGYKLAMAKVRLNHSKLRKSLLKYYGGKCWVSGLAIPRLLICSHIVPFGRSAKNEQNDPDNILLLAPNWDALFDKHFITFGSNGKLMKSKLLGNQELIAMGIRANQALDMSYFVGRRPGFLARHRAEFKKLEKTRAS